MAKKATKQEESKPEILRTADGLPISRFIRNGELFYAVRSVHRINRFANDSKWEGYRMILSVELKEDWLAAKITAQVFDKEGSLIRSDQGVFYHIDRGLGFVQAGSTIMKSRILSTLGIGTEFPDELADTGQFASAEEIDHLVKKGASLLDIMQSDPDKAKQLFEEADAPATVKDAINETLAQIKKSKTNGK